MSSPKLLTQYNTYQSQCLPPDPLIGKECLEAEYLKKQSPQNKIVQYDSLKSNGVISRPKSPLTNVFWNTFSMAWSIGVLFLLTPFMLNRLGATHYGIYMILASICGMMGVMNLGLGEASLRFVAYYFGRNDFVGISRVFQATLFVYSIIALVGTVVFGLSAHLIIPIFALSPVDEVMAVVLARWTALTFACRLIAGCFGAIPQALQRFDIFAKVSIAEQAFRTLGFVSFLLLGYGIWGLVLWNLVTTIFRLIVDIAIANHLMPKLKFFGLPSSLALHEVFGYGVFSFLSQLVGMAWEHADRMIMGVLISAQAVSFLSITKDVVMRGLMITESAGSILMPIFSSINDLEQTRHLFVRSTSNMLCLTIIIFAPLTVVMPDFLSLWISPEFSKQGAFIGQLIAVSSMVRGAFQPYMALFRGQGKPKYVLVVTLLSSVTIITANLVLIPRLGLAGAGYSYCLSAFWGVAAIIFTWRRLLGQDDFTELPRMLLLPLLIGTACIISGFALRNAWPDTLGWIGFISFAALVTVVTTVVVLGYDRHACGHYSILSLLTGRLHQLRPQRGRVL